MVPLFAAVLLLLPTTWIVDQNNGPGTNFTDLPPAVAAAASGDTIIVRTGSYRPFDVSGKALSIVGAGSSATFVSLPPLPGATYGETRIQGVPAGTTFYISGMRFHPTDFPPPTQPLSSAALTILASAGPIVLSSVACWGATLSTSGGPPANSGLSVSNAEVHITGSEFHGGAASYASGGAGAVVSGSTFVADASIFIGGPGFGSQGGGGTGLALGSYLGSTLATIFQCSASGGNGGLAGASGVFVGSGFLRAAGTGSSFSGGAGGFAGGGSAVSVYSGASAILHGSIALNPGGSAPPTQGAVTVGAVPLPYLSIAGTATPTGELSATQPVTVTLDGVIPSAPFAMAIDTVPAFSTAFAPLLLGELLLPFPPASILESSLDAQGMSQFTIIPSVVAPALVGVPLYAQFGVLDAAAGNGRMSNGKIQRFQ